MNTCEYCYKEATPSSDWFIITSPESLSRTFYCSVSCIVEDFKDRIKEGEYHAQSGKSRE